MRYDFETCLTLSHDGKIYEQYILIMDTSPMYLASVFVLKKLYWVAGFWRKMTFDRLGVARIPQ